MNLLKSLNFDFFCHSVPSHFSSKVRRVIKFINRLSPFLFLPLMMGYAAFCIDLTAPKEINLGIIKFQANYNRMSYYQEAFSSSVSEACGYGLKSYYLPSTEAERLGKFFQGKDKSFDCAKFHPTLTNDGFMAGIGTYMMKSVGLWWKVFGISWRSASYMFWFFYCLTLVLLFYIYRLVSNAFIATLATIITGNVYLNQYQHQHA